MRCLFSSPNCLIPLFLRRRRHAKTTQNRAHYFNVSGLWPKLLFSRTARKEKVSHLTEIPTKKWEPTVSTAPLTCFWKIYLGHLSPRIRKKNNSGVRTMWVIIALCWDASIFFFRKRHTILSRTTSKKKEDISRNSAWPTNRPFQIPFWSSAAFFGSLKFLDVCLPDSARSRIPDKREDNNTFTN